MYICKKTGTNILNTTVSLFNISTEAGYEALFKQYYASLCIFASRIIRDNDAAEDIVHEVFIRLWEKRDSIDSNLSVKSYLFTSVHNRCLNYIRDTKKFTQRDEYFENTNIPDVDSKEVEQLELEGKIMNAIQKLPEKCREVFEMCKLQEMKYAEVAQHLGISVKTVENQMGKALKTLRDELGGLFLLACCILFLNGIGVFDMVMCTI